MKFKFSGLFAFVAATIITGLALSLIHISEPTET